jgi:hypothetical protein
MLGISLYNYPYFKLAKTLCLSYDCFCILFNKIGEEVEQVLPGKREVGGRGRGWGVGWRNGPTMLAHMNK